jgi:hypothetical protein
MIPSWARWIQTTPFHQISLKSILICSHLDLQSGFSLSYFPAKTWYEYEKSVRKNPEERSFCLLGSESVKSGMVWFYLLSTYCMTCPSHNPWFYNPNYAYRVHILTAKAMYVCSALSSNRCYGEIWVMHILCVSSLKLSSMQCACADYVCGLWLYYIFPHFLINGTIFVKVYRT